MDDNLTHILEKLTKIDTKVDFIHQDNIKIVLALISVIAASVGLKFIGSPLTVIIATYLACFSSVFILGVIIYKWKKLSVSLRLIRIVFIAFVLFSTTIRLVAADTELITIYAPEWYLVSVNIFFIILCILMSYRSWRS